MPHDSVHDSAPLFLGLDLSTQGLKAVLISEDSNVVHESAVHFDRDLPSYGTTNGAIRGPGDGEVTSPVRMWLEAFDLLMGRMKDAGVNFSKIMAVSGDGQVSSIAVVVLRRSYFPRFSTILYPATRLCILVGERGEPLSFT